MANRTVLLRELRLGLVYTAVLYASFVHDLFRIAAPLHGCVIGFDSYLALDRLASGSQGDAFWAPLSPDYLSQFGLQGVTLSAIARQTQTDLFAFSYAAASLLALVFCAGMAAYFVAVGRWLGRLAGHVGVALMACSLIWKSFAPSLYWAAFLLVLPFQLAWLLEPLCSRSRWRFVALVGAIGLAVMCKCLCGYEYVTSVILSPIAALVFHRVRRDDFGRRTIRPAAGIVSVGLAGFAVALVLHCVQIKTITGKDGWTVIGERARLRTVAVGELAGATSVEPDSAGLLRHLSPKAAFAVNAFGRYFTMPPVAIPSRLLSRTFIPLYWFAILAIVMIVASCCQGLLSRNGRALALALATGFIASISWQVLAVNHMAEHAHLNLVVFYLPFLPLAFVTIGWLIQSAAQKVGAERFVTTALVCGGLVVALANSISTTCDDVNVQAAEQRAMQEVVQRLTTGILGDASPDVQYRIVQAPIKDWGAEFQRSRLGRERVPVIEYCDVVGGNSGAHVVIAGRNGFVSVHRFRSRPQAPGEFLARIPADSIRGHDSVRAFLVSSPRQESVRELRLPDELTARAPPIRE